MTALRGIGVSAGIAVGEVFFFGKSASAAENTPISDIRAELARFSAAQEKAAEELCALADEAGKNGLADAAALFDVHSELVNDPDFTDAVKEAIDEGNSVAYAVQCAGERFSAMFAAMEDSYMQARSRDITDITERLIRLLNGEAQERILPGGDTPVILAAEDLTPSEALGLDPGKILGIVLRGGSAMGHTAILAGIKGIPCVIGVGDRLTPACAGETAALNGNTGEVFLSPDAAVTEEFRRLTAEQEETRIRLKALKGLPAVTPDGKRISLYCNIGSPEETGSVLFHDGEGIGLFRSEFLFLGRETLPTEEEQFTAYRQVLAAMKGKPVTIRTMDIGSDKKAKCLPLPEEENPAMGSRAIRLCLDRPDLFRTQLRALYRASVSGDLSIMFPMIANLWELREAKAACRAVQTELAAEGIPFSREVKLGIMVETPAAALLCNLFAKECDFFSCGTNDLTGYLLGCDRQNDAVRRYFDPHHPALLRLLETVAEAAHEAGIPVGICGELAGDPDLLPFFLSIGIDALSVSAGKVLPLRERIRNMFPQA